MLPIREVFESYRDEIASIHFSTSIRLELSQGDGRSVDGGEAREENCEEAKHRCSG